MFPVSEADGKGVAQVSDFLTSSSCLRGFICGLLGSLSLPNAVTGSLSVLLGENEGIGFTAEVLPSVILGNEVDNSETLTAESAGGKSGVVASLKLTLECFLTICWTILRTTYLGVGYTPDEGDDARRVIVRAVCVTV